MTGMLVSQAEYARRRGVSRQYIGQMVARGVIRLINRKVDPAQADAALAALREPARTERRGKRPSETPAGSIALPAAGGDLPTLLLKTRIKSEVEKAKLLEIKARVEAGKYIDADEVKLAAFNRARVVRDALLNLPDRLAAMLAAESDEHRIHEILNKEIRMALEELTSDAKRL